MNRNDRDKVEWRLWLKKKRQEIFDLHGSQRSEIIIKRVLDLCRKADFRCIMCYISFGSEVDTRELVEELWQLKKTVCVPQCLPHGQMKAVSISCWEDLSHGKYGILEPHDHLLTIPPDEIDLCLVPGLGFCEDGGRIGSGAGFYDRFLCRVTGLKAGLAFDELVFAFMPQEAFDEKMDLIITDKRVVAVDKKEPA